MQKRAAREPQGARNKADMKDGTCRPLTCLHGALAASRPPRGPAPLKHPPEPGVSQTLQDRTRGGVLRTAAHDPGLWEHTLRNGGVGGFSQGNVEGPESDTS